MLMQRQPTEWDSLSSDQRSRLSKEWNRLTKRTPKDELEYMVAAPLLPKDESDSC